MKILFFSSLFFLFAFAGTAEEVLYSTENISVSPGGNSLKTYGKECAVQIDGALLEGIWESMEPIVLLPSGKNQTGKEEAPEAGAILFRSTYEEDYIALGLALCSLRNFALPEEMKNHLQDLCSIELSSPENPAHFVKVTFSPKGLLSAESSSKLPVTGKVRVIRKWFFAEIRLPLMGKGFFYQEGQKFHLKIRRKLLNEKGIPVNYSWSHSLSCAEIIRDKKTYSTSRRVWRNGDFNTFFKRPNRKWAPNWDLGKGDYLQQGWNLNKAKNGIPAFEVIIRPRKHKNEDLDSFVLLKNGDFYQIYKGRERNLSYRFKAKGKGILKVSFYRFNQGIYSRFLGRIPVMTLHISSDEWKSYSGRITKPSARERLALAFETENSQIFLEDAFVTPDHSGKH